MPSLPPRLSPALLGLCLLALALNLTAVRAEEASVGSVLPDIAGTTWVRTTAPPFAGEEGIRFEKDGTLGLIGFSAMNGLTWTRRSNALNIATNTTFRAVPEESDIYMLSNDGQRLVLSAKDDYLAGPWYRDDKAAGVLRGQVSGAADTGKEAALHLELRELEADGRAGRLIAKQSLPLSEAAAPFPFRLFFPTKAIRAGARYAVAAVITEAQELRYYTPQPVAVQPGQTVPVGIGVVARR